MRNKIVFSIAIVAMLIFFGSCRMHTVTGAPYKTWHVSKKTHRHWGAPRNHSTMGHFWGSKRYGPRPHKARGRYRSYQ